jgi:hypothetical protein
MGHGVGGTPSPQKALIGVSQWRPEKTPKNRRSLFLG